MLSHRHIIATVQTSSLRALVWTIQTTNQSWIEYIREYRNSNHPRIFAPCCSEIADQPVLNPCA